MENAQTRDIYMCIKQDILKGRVLFIEFPIKSENEHFFNVLISTVKIREFTN